MTTRTKTRYAPRLPVAERREQLLDAALHLIATGGFEAVTMAAVARQAGVSKPVVYELFPDRAALLDALLEREDRLNLQAIAGVLGELPAGDPVASTVELFRRYFEAVTARPDSWRIVLLPPHATPVEVRDRVEAGRAAITAQVEALIGSDDALRNGPVGSDIEVAAHTIIAIAESGARLVLADPDHFTIDRLTAFAERLVRALRPGP